ncbi:MAG: hypothetical protein ABFD64_07160 [Armatimonadota bacterium]
MVTRSNVWGKLGIIAVFVACVAFYMITLATRTTVSVVKSSMCKNNIELLGRALIAYVEDNDGLMPPLGWDKKRSCPRWVAALNDYRRMQVEEENIISYLKCPSDQSHDTVSYEINPSLSGRYLQDIPEKERRHTAVLFEKCYRDSHWWVFYLDGQVKRTCKSP